MAVVAVKNRRTKMSPGGIITLPVAARKSLGMTPKAGARLLVSVEDGAVWLSQAGDEGGFRVSARGQMELRGEAHETLEAGVLRHFWIELDDEGQRVALRPYD